MSPTGLDGELLAEFEAEARRSYVELLSALSRAAHADVSGPPADVLAALGRLRDCWLEARAMAAPTAEVQARFPLSGPGPVRLIDTLIALIAYSEPTPDRAEQVGLAFHRLGQLAAAVS